MSRSAIASGAVFQERYEIISALRESGFADVYKGRQLATGQPVAIKVMHPIRGSKSADVARRCARFHQEARFCAQLHHPNIVRLIDAGQTDDGTLYTIFEFVPGQNLAEVLAEEIALDPREARYLMLQVLDALGCAHGQNVVHRDLKPSNIMIVSTGARRNALVLDFGIGAVIAGAMEGVDPKLTPSNEILCTPAYAAPEQLLGQPVSVRSDLYAWGLVFLECLTGRPSITGRSLQEVLFRQASPEPIPIPPALLGHPLGALLRRATLKDMAARVVTASSLLRELEACDVDALSREDLVEPARAPRSPPAPSRGAEDASPWRGVASETAPLDAPSREFRAPPSGHAAAETMPSPATPRRVDAPAPTEPEAPALERPDGERRPLTVVCCTFTASGPGLKTTDVEEIDDLLDEQQDACAEIARRHRGRFAGALGDQVLLHFGYPSAQEDDARRAARAALEVVADVAARSAQLTAARGVALEVRIGLHTGLVVAGQIHRYTQHLGTTPQIAARLSAAAAPGTVVVSGETFRLLRSRFALEPMAPPDLSSVARPLAIYRMGQEIPPPAQDQDIAGRDTEPLIGRSQELDLLLQRWGQVRQGIGQSILVTGGPGIGKSRLTGELVRRLHGERHSCLECRCVPDQRSSALYPLIELLERLIETGRDDAPGRRLARLEALLSRRGFDLPEMVPLLAALLSIPLDGRYSAPLDPPPRQKERTLNALATMLFDMAEEQPVLFVVEDLQWADPTTLEWLGVMIADVPSARLMAVFTARPEFSPPWSMSGMLQIQLSRLDRSDVEHLVARLAGGRALPGPVLSQVVDRTDGVPLYVEELTRMVLESGALVEEGDHYRLAEPLSALAIPTTLRGLLVARLDRLGRAKETARIAAALGREFCQDVLCAVSALDGEQVQEDLERLMAADLIHRKRRLNNPTYQFKHVLIRDAAYESLSKRSRRKVHAIIARTLEARFPEIVAARPNLLAHHHAAAEQLERAIAYAEIAAERALKRPANADDTEAIVHVTQALGWLPAIADARERALSELRLNSLLILALVRRRGYMPRELEAAVHRCEELSDELGESSMTPPTLWAMFWYHHMRSHRREARAIAERWLDLARRSQDTAQLVSSMVLLGQCSFFEGKLAEARQQLDGGIALYDPRAHREHAFFSGVDVKVWAQYTLAVVLYLMGCPAQALAHGQAAVAWARELDHLNSLGMALLHLAGVYHYAREREQVSAMIDSLLRLTEHHQLWVTAHCWALRCWTQRDLEQLRQHIETIRDGGQQSGLPYWLSLVAELEAERGQHEAAVEQLAGCLLLAEESGDVYYVAELYRMKGLSLHALGAGAEQESERCLRRSIAVAREQGARTFELRSTVALCQMLVQQARRDEARPLLRQLTDWPVECADLPDFATVRALLQEVTD
ncbi:Protein kinase [Sorangium cellulosum So ce56]|uniref:Protein kinase n=1 Tax=Sorangium cellulosum (strain So ce56) TaxID=448385 RepID=A9FRW7_SORC5|nr:TOMM system kinase/cyclase fusion protein [Sorangium cellulosum]CAN95336.1 Protein kinase [Sorangium cellulosum So ce56]